MSYFYSVIKLTAYGTDILSWVAFGSGETAQELNSSREETNSELYLNRMNDLLCLSIQPQYFMSVVIEEMTND
jgi:hypothetical protein